MTYPRARSSGFRNEFAWSVTRQRNLDECLRRYFYAHYAHWNGWRADAPELARRCYRLGKITHLPMWTGQVVHEIVEDVLRAARDQWPRRAMPHPAALRDAARNRLRRGWRESRDRAWERDPKRCVNLFEHYFGLEIPKERTDEIAAHVYRCLETFAELDVVQTVFETDPLNWLCIEEFERFDLGDYRVVVRLDLALRNGKYADVFDWKTGKEHASDRRQLLVYALAATRLWNLDIDLVRLTPVYLATGHAAQFHPSPEEAIETREEIYLGCHKMADLLVDRDVDCNEPLPEEAFARTENRAACTRCTFQELCFPADELPVHAAAPGTEDGHAAEGSSSHG
jgi:hypothetical protein